jgi:mRNA-degrading endonuclease RelE of RelBE toxin-antitoxin system
MPGEHGSYRVGYHPLVVKKDIPALPKTMRVRIKKAIEQRLMTEPLRYGKPLRFSHKGHRRIRVGDWRVVYRIEEERKKMVVLIICHRKDVYASLSSRSGK